MRPTAKCLLDCYRRCSWQMQLQRASCLDPGTTKGIRRRTIRPSTACAYAGCQSGSRFPCVRADGVKLGLSHHALPLVRRLRCNTAEKMARERHMLWRHNIEHQRGPSASKVLGREHAMLHPGWHGSHHRDTRLLMRCCPVRRRDGLFWPPRAQHGRIHIGRYNQTKTMKTSLRVRDLQSKTIP